MNILTQVMRIDSLNESECFSGAGHDRRRKANPNPNPNLIQVLAVTEEGKLVSSPTEFGALYSERFLRHDCLSVLPLPLSLWLAALSFGPDLEPAGTYNHSSNKNVPRK